ncbi:MAG: L,D-transpeptidase family protein [Salegentibacter sp.]
MSFKGSTLALLLLCFFILSCGNDGNTVKKSENPSASTNTAKTEDTPAPPPSPDLIEEAFSQSTDTASVGKINLRDFPKLQNYYEKRKNQPVWSSEKLRKELVSNIKNIDKDGLFPSDYHLEYLQERSSTYSDLSLQERAILDIVLSDAFFKVAGDLNHGKLDPEKIYKIWGTRKNEIDLPKLLNKAVSEENVTAALDSARPHQQLYRGLKKSLQDYEKLVASEGEITHIPEGEMIRPGEENTRITSVAKRLEELGYLSEKAADSAGARYSEEIQKAVRSYQQNYGLQVDGILGKGTVANLNMSAKDRYNQILANLERWRWYPHDLGAQYIIVNIANYKLHVIKNGDTISTHKIIVGRPSMETPVFSDKIQYVVYNPTWTIPPTIKKQEVIPGASKDLAYLEKKKIDIYKNGEKINRKDWNPAEARNYTYRQGAGSSNPLGRVKIIYPNKYMIYLHDTPARYLFKKDSRAESHGCVRVENVLDLSRYLLSNRPEYNEATIDTILSSGKTTQIEVTQPVQVHHFYWTAWRENGKTRFTSDIYQLDPKLIKLLKPEN